MVQRERERERELSSVNAPPVLNVLLSAYSQLPTVWLLPTVEVGVRQYRRGQLASSIAVLPFTCKLCCFWLSQGVRTRAKEWCGQIAQLELDFWQMALDAAS